MQHACPTTYFISCLHPILAPCPTAPRLHWPRPCVLQPLNMHMGVPRSRCSTPWSHHALCLPHPFNISNAYPLPAPSSPRSRCSTPSCPLLTSPHSRCSTPRCPHVFCATTYASRAFCPPHTSFVSLPGVGGTGRQPLNTNSQGLWFGLLGRHPFTSTSSFRGDETPRARINSALRWRTIVGNTTELVDVVTDPLPSPSDSCRCRTSFHTIRSRCVLRE